VAAGMQRAFSAAAEEFYFHIYIHQHASAYSSLQAQQRLQNLLINRVCFKQ